MLFTLKDDGNTHIQTNTRRHTHTHTHSQKIVKSQRNIFYVALNANKTDMLKLYL